MTQDEVFKLLKKKKKWMTAEEISQILKVQRGSVSCSLNKMQKYNEVKRKDQNGEEIKYISGAKPYLWKVK